MMTDEEQEKIIANKIASTSPLTLKSCEFVSIRVLKIRAADRTTPTGIIFPTTILNYFSHLLSEDEKKFISEMDES